MEDVKVFENQIIDDLHKIFSLDKTAKVYLKNCTIKCAEIRDLAAVYIVDGSADGDLTFINVPKVKIANFSGLTIDFGTAGSVTVKNSPCYQFNFPQKMNCLELEDIVLEDVSFPDVVEYMILRNITCDAVHMPTPKILKRENCDIRNIFWHRRHL